MINVCVGYSKRFVKPCLRAFENAIRQNTSEDVCFYSASPDYLNVPESGCTGFTNCRYMAPELMNYEGFAIYLDIDMLVLGDIKELWDYRQEGKWVCIQDGQTEVSVIDCSAFRDMPDKHRIAANRKNRWERAIERRKVCKIPDEWNVYDCFLPNGWEPTTEKLLHFTDLKHQPWFFEDHHCPKAVSLWADYGGKVMDSYLA